MPIITRRWSSSELGAASRGVLWLCVLQWQGAQWLFAPYSVTAPSPCGSGTTQWIGGLADVDYRTTCEPYQYDSAVVSASVTLSPHPDLPVALRIGRDRALLQGASVTLYRWIVGSSFMRLIATGDVDSHSYQVQQSAAISLSIKGRPWQDAALLMPRTAAITSSTFSTPSTTTDAEPYPLTMGEPGAAYSSPGTVALPTGVSSRLLLNYGEVGATTVTIHDKDGNTEAFATSTGYDDLGQLYTYVDISLGSAVTYADDGEYYTQWQQGTGAQIGNDGAAILTVGQAVAWLAERTGLRWDVPRLQGLASALTYRIDASWRPGPKEEITTWQALQDILSDWPVGLRSQSAKLDLVFWDPFRPRYRAHLEHGVDGVVQMPGPQRSGNAREAPTVYVANFARDPVTGDYTQQLALVPSATLGYGTGATVSRILERAWIASGFRVREERLDLPTLWDSTSAAFVLEARSAWNSRGGESIEIVVPRHIPIEAGDEVSWTRSEIGVTCARAWVSAVRVRLDGTQIITARLFT